MTKRFFIYIVTALFCINTFATSPSFLFFGKKKAKQTTVTATPKKTAYDKALEGKYDKVSSELMTLYKIDGKLFIELPRKTFGRDMLLGATISSVSNPQLAMFGFKNSNLVQVSFAQKDSSVIMQVVNSDLTNDATDKKRVHARSLNSYTNLNFYKFPIKGYGKDSTVLFDASSFFLKEDRFFPILQSAVGSNRVNSTLRESQTRITALKVFKKNASISQERSYTINITPRSGKGIENYPVVVGVNFTLALLPEIEMRPRLSDTRVGLFLTNKTVETDGKIENVNFIKRWRIEPKDSLSYFQGQLVEPVKPITFYIENTFPKGWKEAISAGVLRWNKAFERIGFKNVISVRDFPTKEENPEFDPDNFEYSCIRFSPMAVENAMGPSWIDPRTGEIINATVLVYNDIINVINNWRFVQTAQIEPLARTERMPDSLIYESLEYIIAHEIGHTLGFMHNMAASAAIPTDSLRSVSFTQKYGTTASIMDYARYNYVAQPTDKGVRQTPPFLGEYDYFLVDWTYRVFPNSKGFKDDFKQCSELVERHQYDPMYRYGVQQVGRRNDPSAIEEDLSNDPIKASDYGMNNLKYILSHFDEWLSVDKVKAERRAELYNEILMQAFGYVNNVFTNIPGIYLYQTSESSELPRYKVVPRDEQRASALWVLKWAREFSKLSNDKIEAQLPYASNRPFSIMQRDVQAMAMGATSRLALSYYLDSTSYSPMEYCEDVYNNVFAKTISGDETLNEADLSMQSLYVSYLKPAIDGAKQIEGLHNFTTPSLSKREEVVEAYPYCCFTHSKIEREENNNEFSFLGFGENYGFPKDLWGQTINRPQKYFLHYAYKLQSLLGEAVNKTKSPMLLAHYRLLQSRLEQLLNK